MRILLLLSCVWLLVVSTAGCVSARAPERIYVGSPHHSDDVESSNVPRTSSHEEANRELAKAYRRVRELERENDRCREKLEESRDEIDDCEHKYDRLKDRYDD